MLTKPRRSNVRYDPSVQQKRWIMDLRVGTWNEMRLQEVGWSGMDWIDLAQDWDGLL